MSTCTLCHKYYCGHNLGGIVHIDGDKTTITCVNCGETVPYPTPYWAVAMFEGQVVDPEETEEWGGFDVCKPCFDKVNAGMGDATVSPVEIDPRQLRLPAPA